MNGCHVLRMVSIVVLSGGLGCSAARSSLADEMADRFDKRISDLEAKNKALEQQVDELKIDSAHKNERLSHLQEKLISISPEAKKISTQPVSSEVPEDAALRKIKKAGVAPLASESTKEQR